MEILQTLIPPSHLAAVESALQQTFRTMAVQELVLLPGGLSASPVFKIAINDQPYVLKLGNLSGNMEIAAEAGIAPPVYYSNKTTGLSIAGFIENTARVSIQELARTIRRIHELPPFPDGNNLVTTVDSLIAQFEGSALAACLTYYAEIRKHYPWDDTDRVPSHNDLNPGNTICDGAKI